MRVWVPRWNSNVGKPGWNIDNASVPLTGWLSWLTNAHTHWRGIFFFFWGGWRRRGPYATFVAVSTLGWNTIGKPFNDEATLSASLRVSTCILIARHTDYTALASMQRQQLLIDINTLCVCNNVQVEFFIVTLTKDVAEVLLKNYLSLMYNVKKLLVIPKMTDYILSGRTVQFQEQQSCLFISFSYVCLFVYPHVYYCNSRLCYSLPPPPPQRKKSICSCECAESFSMLNDP